MFGGMENMSTFAAFTARTITYLKQSGKFFIVCGVPCISNWATNPHGLLDCSSDLFLPERGEVALSAFNNLYFSFMARTMETARKREEQYRFMHAHGGETPSVLQSQIPDRERPQEPSLPLHPFDGTSQRVQRILRKQKRKSTQRLCQGINQKNLNQNTMESIKTFNNPQFGEVRTAGTEEPLFCLADVCRVLEIGNPSQVKARLNPNGIRLIDLNDLCQNEGVIISELGNRKATFINEQNLYKVIMRSDKPQAEPFQDWVCGEVLPSIRKHGMYATEQKLEDMLLNPDAMIKTLQVLKEERNKRIEAENKAKELQPKALFADAVATSQRSCLIAELAKILQQNGMNIGQNRLFKWLRENGYLCNKGQYYNQPTQKAMQMGLFEIKRTTINKPDGSVLVSTTTKVSGKGQVYFVNKFLGKGNIFMEAI